MTTFIKEQLIAKLQHRLAVATKYPDLEEAQFDAAIFKIALASLEAEPVNQPSSNHPSADAVVGCEIKQPSTNEHVTQIKQVADLYEFIVPGGRSTTFTTDAVDAKYCADMGWKVQEYVKLERYQSAMLQGVEPDFREISNSSTNNCRENAETSTNCPCCGRKPLKHSKCSVPECGRKHFAHGMCHRHYDMKRREDPEQVEKFREANRRFTARKRANKAAPQQEVKP